MTQMIQWFLGMALWGSVVCLAVLLTRPLIKKISNRFMRLLWVIVIVRFLCPLAIESPIMIIRPNTTEKAVNTENYSQNTEDIIQKNTGNYAKINTENYTQTNTEDDTNSNTENYITTNTQTNAEDYINNNTKTNLYKKSGNGFASKIRANALEKSTSAQSIPRVTSKQASAGSTFTIASVNAWFSSDFGRLVIMICGVIWGCGTIVFLAIGTVRYLRIRRFLKEAISADQWEKYPVKVSDFSGVPMSFGIFHPVIYLPPSFEECESAKANATFSFRQKEMILWHEAMHLKHHDPLLKLAILIMLAAHWWNPLVWLCVKFMNKDIEMACDEAVLAKIGQRNRRDYAETLFWFAKSRSGISMIASFGESNAEDRIKNALRYRKPTIVGTTLAMILVISLSGCLAIRPFGTDVEERSNDTDSETVSEQMQETETSEGENDGNEASKDALANSDITNADNGTNASKGALTDSDIVNQDDRTNVGNEISVASADKTYYEAYKKVIDDYVKDMGCQYEDLSYDFIYFNDDDIPDLVIDYASWIHSLYSYVDGKVYTLLDREEDSYGGCVYIDYLKRKGTIYTYGNDYAGAIGYWSVWFLNSNHEFDKLCFVSEGADVEEDDPQYEEIKKFLAENKGWYFNEERISEEEAKNKFKEYSVDYNVEGLEGKNTLPLEARKTWDEMKKILEGYDSPEQTNDNAVKKQDKGVSAASLYEGFQNGTEKLYFDRFQGNGSGDFVTEVANALETNKGYTLSEFKKLVCDVYNWRGEYTKVEFDDLDCGQDGVLEMAMKIKTLSMDQNRYPLDMPCYETTYIIKEDAGKLYCTFGFDVDGRKYGYFKKSGIYTQESYYDDESEGGESGILDSDGTYHLIYQYIMDAEYRKGTKIEENLVGADEIIRDKFHLSEDEPLFYSTVKIDGKTYTFLYSEKVSDDDIYDALTKAGKTVISPDEIIKLALEAEKRNGYTQELETANPLFEFYLNEN